MKEFIDKLIERLEEEKEGYSDTTYYTLGIGSAIKIVNELAEEYKLSEMPTCWIPCSKKMPEAGTQRDVWISIENEVISYKAKWYLDHFEWDNGWAIKENILAWMPNDVPAPYSEGD